MKFDFKNGKTYFDSLISPPFDELHSSTIVHMNHMENMFQDLPFLLHQEGPKKPQSIFSLLSRGGTHFLVLAQTLIYIMVISPFSYKQTKREDTRNCYPAPPHLLLCFSYSAPLLPLPV